MVVPADTPALGPYRDRYASFSMIIALVTVIGSVYRAVGRCGSRMMSDRIFYRGCLVRASGGGKLVRIIVAVCCFEAGTFPERRPPIVPVSALATSGSPPFRLLPCVSFEPVYSMCAAPPCGGAHSDGTSC